MKNRILVPVFSIILVGTFALAPSNLTFSNITSSTLSVSFTNSSSPDGYIVLRREGTAVTDDPEDGITYSVGNTINAGIVVFIGDALSFNETGLAPSTTYHYAIFAYNGSGEDINYLTSLSLEGSAVTLADEPMGQPTNLTFSGLAPTSFTGNFAAASDTPEGYLVLRREGMAVTNAPVDGTSYSAGNTISTSTVVYAGAAISFDETGLTPATSYHYAIFSFNGSGESTNYLTSSPLTGSAGTPDVAPLAQPTNLTFANITPTSFTGNFSAASGSPDGYLVLGMEGAAVTDAPVDGTTYPEGSTINASTVVYVGNAHSFGETGLISSTTYHYAIFSHNGSGESTNYLTSSPLTGSVVTMAEPPVAQPSNLTFSDLTSTSLTGNFAAASDNPHGYLVLRRVGTAVTDAPVDGTTYPAGSIINASTVVYTGSSLSFNETGLTHSTTYHYAVFSYNGSAGSTNYLTSSPLRGSSVTMAESPVAQPSNLTFSGITSTSFTGNFTAASGNPDGYLVLRKEGTAVTDTPSDGTAYLPDNTVNASTVVYAGNALLFSETGLTPSTTYHYAVFAYSGSGGSTNYLTSSPLAGSAATLAEANVGQPSNLTFSNLTSTSFTGNFTDADPIPNGYIVLMCRNVPPDIDPVDGVPYTQNQILGTTSGNNVYAVSIGSGTSFSIGNLTPGAQLFFKVYSYNGSGASINYLTSLPLSGSQRALHNEPTIQASAINFNAATSSSLSLNFINGNGSSRMVVVRAGSPVDSGPLDGIGYTANSTFGNGSQIGTGNFIVGSGSGLFTVTGLAIETVYHFRVYEFNGSDGSENYNVSSASGNPASRSSIKVWHVSNTGSDSDDGSSGSPLRNIQTALTQALGGEEIKVSNGTYNEELITSKRAVLLGGFTSDFLDSNRDIYLNRTTVKAVSNSVLRDANGSTIDGFFFDGNNTAETGLNISSSSVVTHNIIVRCRQSPGRGISLSGSALVANNTIHDNITGTRISGGTSATAKFKNNIVTGNTFGLNNSSANGIHRYNDIQGNISDYAGNFDNPGTGDISLNPLYVNSSSDDFRLLGTSPAIDGGDPADPVGDEPMPNGGRIDLGSYGGTINAPIADALMAEPTNQATALTFSTIAATSLVLNFTSGNGSSRLVVARAGSAIDFDPVDGAPYSANSAFGSGDEIGTGNYVVGSGSSPIAVAGLTPGTVYHFRVYEFNGSGGKQNYLTSEANGNPANKPMLAIEPTIQASVITFSFSGATSVGVNSTNGNGASRLVVARAVSSVASNPVDGVSYLSNAQFGSGSQIGTGNYVVHSGPGSVNVTGLTTGATYYFRVYEFNGSGGTENYLVDTAIGNPASQSPLDPLPTISNFNPISGGIGLSITITGTNFHPIPANNTVQFNNTTAVVTASDATSITTSVPSGATTGKIKVTVAGQTATSANDFTVTSATAPTLSGFNPTSGPVGTPVTLTGTNFDSTPANNAVTFNNVTAVVTASNATSITTSVPSGATTGKIAVTVAGQTATSANNFTVSSPSAPTLNGFNPTSGPAGTTITLTGTNFASTPANNTVKFFNNIPATVTASSETSITTSVPSGAAIGPVKVTVAGQTATSAMNFTVTIGNPPVVVDDTPSSIDPGNPVSIAAQITAESTITSAALEYRSVATGGVTTSMALTASGSTYTTQILASEIGDLGIEYKISATSTGGTTTAPWKTVKINRGNGLIIPYSSFGKGQSNYRIVAVPLELTSKTIANVFDELGAYDKTRWRMYRFNDGRTNELGPAAQILPGLGYWLIVKDNPGTAINSGAGISVQTSTDVPFEIDLAADWNQIGNPYDFNLSWADIQAANPGLPGLRKFNGDFIDGTQLDKMEGGFVKVTSAQKLRFPVVKNSFANGGRSKEETKPFLHSLDQPNWQVYFTLQQGNVFNRISGFGMNEKASVGFDIYDGFNLPRFFETILNVNHNKIQGADYCSSDVVPTAENQEWEFSVESSSEERLMTLTWNNSYFGHNDMGLVLWDNERQLGTDMRSANRYDFDRFVSRTFKVFFGSREEILEKTEVKRLIVHSVSPNPSVGDIRICFSTPQDGLVTLEAVDLLGRKVWSSENDFSKGYHEVVWVHEDRADINGIHVIRIQDGSAAIQERIYLK